LAGDKLIAHHRVRPSRDLAGLFRRGQDRLDGVVDRAAVGDDSAGRPSRAEGLSFGGIPSAFAGSAPLVSSSVRAKVVESLRIGPAIMLMAKIKDIADTTGDLASAGRGPEGDSFSTSHEIGRARVQVVSFRGLTCGYGWRLLHVTAPE
jgi:hypothetical protein